MEVTFLSKLNCNDIFLYRCQLGFSLSFNVNPESCSYLLLPCREWCYSSDGGGGAFRLLLPPHGSLLLCPLVFPCRDYATADRTLLIMSLGLS